MITSAASNKFAAEGLKNKVIFSSDVDTLTVMEELIALGVRFEVVFGVYLGEPEVSYIVDTATFDNNIKQHPMLSGQKCVMYIEFDGRAFLDYFVEDHVEYIGIVKQTGKPEGISPSYTYVPAWDAYFTTQQS